MYRLGLWAASVCLVTRALIMSCTVSSPCALLQICNMQYERGGPYAGLFLFTEQARMARPVRQVKSQKTEMVGSLEQSTMHIRCAH